MTEMTRAASLLSSLNEGPATSKALNKPVAQLLTVMEELHQTIREDSYSVAQTAYAYGHDFFPTFLKAVNVQADILNKLQDGFEDLGEAEVAKEFEKAEASLRNFVKRV